MASSWITTPHLRPSSDTTSSESHPGVLAHERAGPLAISAAQICVKIGEDGQPSLPSDVVLDKRYTHGTPAVMTLQAKDGPPAPSDVHTNVFTAYPLLKHNQVARPRSPSSSPTFERQVLASVPTTNSQPVAPISAAGSLTPPLPPDSPDARPISTTDISTAGSPTIGYSLPPTFNQSLTQSPNPERGQPARQVPRRSGTMGTFGTIGGNSMVQTEYTDMVFESIPFHFNVISNFFVWLVLAGFLVLPSTFQKILESKLANTKVGILGNVVRNVPLLVIGFTCCGVGAIGMCCIWWRFRHNCLWLLSSIFIPGMFGGISGLISTFVNLYGSRSQEHVHYGPTTIATIAAAGGCAVICGFLTIIYGIKKHLVKSRHDRISRERSDSGDEIKEKL